jgi:hypothetical protein
VVFFGPEAPRDRIIGQSDLEFAGGQTMIDRDIKELLIGFCALGIFAVLLVWLQQ